MKNNKNVNEEAMEVMETVVEETEVAEVEETENKGFKAKVGEFWKKNNKKIGVVAGVLATAAAIGTVIYTIFKANGDEDVLGYLNEGESDNEDIIDVEPMEVVDVIE